MRPDSSWPGRPLPTPHCSRPKCRWRRLPPNSLLFSTSVTAKPWSARPSAAVMPLAPPPTTRAPLVIGICAVVSGSRTRVRAADMRTRSLALAVALSLSLPCTQEHWLRILAMSNRYGLSPAARRLLSNSGACVSGEQLAMTRRLAPASFTVRVMWAMLSCEQA